MKVVVTGAAGRLGAQTCRELVAAGHQVTGIDKVWPNLPGIRPLQLDLLVPPASWPASLAGAKAVVHLANHIGWSYGSSEPVLQDNVAMNFNILEAARAAQVGLVIFASSVQVMTGERSFHDPVFRGSLPWLPLDSDYPAAPTNPYALSKALGEDMLRYLARNTDITAVTLRFPLLLREPPQLTGPLRTHRRLDEAFTWLTFNDAARLVTAVLAASLKGFKIYFPAASRPWLAEEVETLRRRCFPGVPVKGGTPLLSFVDCRAITRDTGWSPQDL